MREITSYRVSVNGGFKYYLTLDDAIQAVNIWTGIIDRKNIKLHGVDAFGKTVLIPV